MGFWDVGDGRTIGDGPLDSAAGFLANMMEIYQDGLGRKPTLDEVLLALQRELEHRADLYVQGGETLKVVDIRAKVKKAPKKQEYKIGDVFVVPIGDSEYINGRVTPQRNFYEFFNERFERLVRVHELAGIPTVWLRYLITDEALTERRWVIVGNLPYKEGEFEPKPRLYDREVEADPFTTAADGYLVSSSNRTRPATPQERKTLPRAAFASPDAVESDLLTLIKRRRK